MSNLKQTTQPHAIFHNARVMDMISKYVTGPPKETTPYSWIQLPDILFTSVTMMGTMKDSPKLVIVNGKTADGNFLRLNDGRMIKVEDFKEHKPEPPKLENYIKRKGFPIMPKA